jgi:hypothetical protein
MTPPFAVTLTHSRRIASVFGDGADALRTGRLCGGLRLADACYVYARHAADGSVEIVRKDSGIDWTATRIVARGCPASWPAPLDAEGVDTCLPPIPPRGPFVFPDPPHNHPRPPATLVQAHALMAEVALVCPDLSVEIVGHTEQRYGCTTLLALVHRKGGRGTFELRRTWGETFVQDFEDVPWPAAELVRDAWERIVAADKAVVVAGKGAS